MPMPVARLSGEKHQVRLRIASAPRGERIKPERRVRGRIWPWIGSGRRARQRLRQRPRPRLRQRPEPLPHLAAGMRLPRGRSQTRHSDGQRRRNGGRDGDT